MIRTSTLRRLLPLLAFVAAATPAAPHGGHGDEPVEFIQFLASTGEDADGTARARLKMDDDSTSFDVELEDLPAGDYELWVAALLKGTITVDGTGEGELEFKFPQDGVKPLLDFGVEDQLIEIKQAATVFFSDTFGAPAGGGGDAGDKTKTEVFLVNVGPDADAHGKLKYEAKSGKLKFSVEVEDLAAGSYHLLVDGAVVASIDADGVETELEFQLPAESGKLLLGFDPLGALIEVESEGTVFLVGLLPASNTDTGTKPPATGKKACKDLGKTKGDALEVVLLNSGLLPGASGKVELSKTGEVELEVEVEDLTDGTYDLVVDGVDQGDLVVTGGEGELKYSTSPEASELLLTFPVQGLLIEIKSGPDAVLSVVFPVSVQAALGKFKKELHTDDHVRINLASTGADLDANGTADFKDRPTHDTLALKLADLDVGSYDVLIDDVVKASFELTKQDGKAKITLDTAPKGNQVLLDVPVLGATIKITPAGDAGTVLLVGTVE